MTEHDRIHCEEVVASLLEYLDDEIDDEKRVRIERHLAECRDCYSRAEFEQALRRKLRALDSTPPPTLTRRLKALLDGF